MNYIDMKTDEEKAEFERQWNSPYWNDNTKQPGDRQLCVIKGHWFTSKNRVIEKGIRYDIDEGWNANVNNSFVVEGWKAQ